MTRTGQDAIDYARGRVGTQMPASGYCLQFVRQCFDVGSYYGSAIDAWNGAEFKHPGDRNPPPAVPLYFYTPSQYDHVTFCVSPGEVISTFNEDIRSFSGISSIEANFDGQYIGWAEDINGVRIYEEVGEAPDMTPDEAQRLMNIESAVGRLDAMWTASDGRNRVHDFDQANDWTEQTTGAVGRIETDIDAAVSSSQQSWTPSHIGAAVALILLALMVVAVVVITAATGAVPGELVRATLYLAFVIAGGLLGRHLGSRHG